MKITKYTHSCLFIEENGKFILIDPGTFSTEAGLTVDMFSRIDYLLITHEHFDHFDNNFVKQLVQKFPHIQIITTNSIVSLLAKNEIQAVSRSNNDIQVDEKAHEHIFGVQTVPENVCFTIFSKLTHPGDSMKFEETAPILALPIQAPWGNTTEALEKAYQLKPKYVIPIHDWHWNTRARESLYKRAKEYLATSNIIFIEIQDKEEYNLNL